MVRTRSDDKSGERLDVGLVDQRERKILGEQRTGVFTKRVLVRDLQDADVVRASDPRRELLGVIPGELGHAMACLRELHTGGKIPTNKHVEVLVLRWTGQ